MLTWFIYDISENKTRRKIVKLAEQKGLYRVQKSVFLGTIDNNILDEIILKSRGYLNLETDSLYIFPVCEKDFKNIKLLGQAFNKELVTDELKALII